MTEFMGMFGLNLPTIALILVFISILICLYIVSRGWRKDNDYVESSTVKQNSILETLEYGDVEVIGYQELGNSEYAVHVRTPDGPERYIIIKEEDIEPKNNVQCIAGKERQYWRYVGLRNVSRGDSKQAVNKLKQKINSYEEVLREIKLKNKELNYGKDSEVDKSISRAGSLVDKSSKGRGRMYGTQED